MARRVYQLHIDCDLPEGESLVLTRFPAMRSQFDEGSIPEFQIKPKSLSSKIKFQSQDHTYTYTSTQEAVDDGQLLVCKAIDNKIVCRPLSHILTYRPDFTHLDQELAPPTEEEIRPVIVKFGTSKSAEPVDEEEPVDNYKVLDFKSLKKSDNERKSLFNKVITGKSFPDIKPKIENMDVDPPVVSVKPSEVKSIMRKAKVASFSEICQAVGATNSESGQKSVLEALNEHAILVQGNWAIKSEVLYGDSSKRSSTDKTGISINLFIAARDYLLWLFDQNRLVNRLAYSRTVKMPDHDVLELFNQLSSFKKEKMKWEFKLPKDQQFIDAHPEIVQRQKTFWKVRRANKLSIFN